MKLKVILDRISCRDTEDIVGSDEIYIQGAVAADSVIQPILTKPVDIREGQILAFADDQRVIFNGELPKSGNLIINLRAIDSDFGKDWEGKGYRKAVREIADSLAENAHYVVAPALAVATAGLNPFLIPVVSYVGGLAADKAAKVVVGIVDKGVAAVIEASDPDDVLGTLEKEIAVADLGHEARVMPGVWSFKETGIGVSTWDYDIHYSIHIEP
ncbi:hypothetical protein [Streptomyces sp. NPDC002537]